MVFRERRGLGVGCIVNRRPFLLTPLATVLIKTMMMICGNRTRTPSRIGAASYTISYTMSISYLWFGYKGLDLNL